MPSASGKSPGGQITTVDKNIDSTMSLNDVDSTTSMNTKEKNAVAAVGASGSNLSMDGSNPMKQAITTIEHKIRNLEKRKTKLESYRAIQATGKELSSDQKSAVAKYDAVIATLDFARDLSKQMLQFSKDAEKEQRKQLRKDLVTKALSETAKIREVLVIQNILASFCNDSIRADFSNGVNGAIKIEASDIEALRKFHFDVQVRRPENADELSFVAATQKAAEFLSMTVDGRPKQYETTTFENMRKMLTEIQDCGYLDNFFLNAHEPTADTEESNFVSTGEGDETGTTEESLDEGIEKLNMNVSDGDGGNGVNQSVSVSSSDSCGLLQNPLPTLEFTQQKNQIKEQVEHHQQPINIQVPTATGIPAPPSASGTGGQNFQSVQPSVSNSSIHVNVYQQMQPQPPHQLQQVTTASILNLQQGQPPQMVGAPPQQQRQLMSSPAGAPLSQGTPIPMHGAPQPGHFPPTTVRAVEQVFFKQQYMQQLRPLAEVIGGGNFFFLQDSELDSPEIGGMAGNSAPVGNVVFDQQQQQQQQHTQPLQQIHRQQQPTSTNTDIHTSTDLHKVQDSQSQQQLMVSSIQTQQQPPTQQQPIPTQTFTNQSFPPIQQVQTAPPNNSTTPTMGSTNPSPMFQQKAQLFSPVGTLQQQQLLHQQDVVSAGNSSQQMLLNEQQQPMMIMARLAAPQARLPPQQPAPQSLGMPQGEVTGSNVGNVGNAGFPFDNPVVTTLTYEQQMQQQIASAGGLKPNVSEDKKADENRKFNSDSVNEWEVSLKNSTHGVSSNATLAQSNASATAALTNVLKPGNLETNKWSTEMNAAGTPQTASNTQTRKNEWTSGGGNSGGGAPNSFGETSTQSSDNSHEPNHWNSNQQDTGYGGRSGGRGPNNYQRRNDDRRDRDDRSRTGGSSGYRGRPNNYSSQQNGGSRGSGGGMYFRNNENSNSGSYYQNGSSNAYSGKDGTRYDGGGGNYRGSRNSGNVRGNGPPSRSMGRNNGGGNSGGGSTNSSYINRQSNRMPMGLDKN